MKSAKKTIIFNLLYTALAVAIIFVAWWAMSAATDSEFVVPSVGATFSAFKDVFQNPFFWDGLIGTLLRSTVGFAVATALFLVAFLLSTAFEPFKRVADIIIGVMRSLPAVAVTLILILAVGGNVTPVVLGVLVIFPIMYSAAIARTATTPTELKEICVLCGGGKFTMLKSVYLPCLAGGLPESLATAFSYNIKAVIGAEILAQTVDSLGMLMKLSQVYFQPAMLMAFVITAVVLSVILEVTIRGVLKIALRRFADD
ncbi:MAG: ABC transporter permease subunit [Clostridiales bacterium]|nr:ABC transporter permease subunit [Clostridiales bacterium]